MKASRINKVISVVLVFCFVFTMDFFGLSDAYAANNKASDTTAALSNGISAYMANSTISDTAPSLSSGTSSSSKSKDKDIGTNTASASTDNMSFTELTDKRGLSTKSYSLGNNRYETVLYSMPVHYLDNGVYKDIDNSLTLATDNNGKTYYTNQANSFKASFSNSIDGGWSAGISEGNYQMKWMMQGVTNGLSAAESDDLSKDKWNTMTKGEQRRELPNQSTHVDFTDSTQNTILDYQLISDMIKETITVNSYTGVNTYQQRISLKGLDLIQNKDGTIVAVDSKDHSKIVFYLTQPSATDNSVDGITNDNITVTLSNAKDANGKATTGTVFGATADTTQSNGTLFSDATNTYILTYTLDPNWMKNAVYPVVIDPIVRTSLSTSAIKDTRLCQDAPDTNYYLSSTMSTGGNSGQTNYSIVEFTGLPTLGASDMVTNAVFAVVKSGTSSASSYVAAHQITQAWDSTTATYNTFFADNQTYDDNDPNSAHYHQHYDPEVEDFKKIETSSLVQYTWDITRIAKKWYSGSPENGILLADMGTAYKTWYTSDSSYHPVCYIDYVDYSGLESYWDYATESIDRSGTAHTNLYNGNLVYTFTDLAMTGNLLPITVSHTFNSTEANNSDKSMLYGNGWMTNYDQRQFSVQTDSQGNLFYRYIDGDGTTHYFINTGTDSSPKWQDESGLGLKLSINNNKVPTITDKQNNVLTFYSLTLSGRPNGYLYQITDHNGNTQTINYNSYKVGSTTYYLIATITNSAGQTVTFNRNDSNYPNYLSSITDSAGRSISYGYNASNQLHTITYEDGKQTTFNYDASNGNITSVIGIDGKTITFEYPSSSPYRLKHMYVTNTTSDGTEYGSDQSFIYGDNRTEITTKTSSTTSRKTVYEFNDNGNTICVIGPDGTAQYSSHGTTLSTSKNDVNKVTSASKSEKFGKNYLENSGFEANPYISNWTVDGVDITRGSGYLGCCVEARYDLVFPEGADDDIKQQVTTLKQGMTYTLSCYVNAALNPTGYAKIGVEYYDDQGTLQSIYSDNINNTNGWQRFAVTFTIPLHATSGTVTVEAISHNPPGTQPRGCSFDCFQLEDGKVANRYNLVDNADFDFYDTNNAPTGWTTYQCGTSDKVTTPAADGNIDDNQAYMSDTCFKFTGSPSQDKYIEQIYDITGSKGDVFVLGGWCKGLSIPIDGSTTIKYGLAIRFDSDDWQKIYFTPGITDWQYVCGKAVAGGDYTTITLRVEMDYNANYGYFDGIQLFKEGFDDVYTYDANGNMTEIDYLTNNNSTDVKAEYYTYDSNNNLKKIKDTAGNETNYTYDSYNNMLTSTSATGVLTTYDYDTTTHGLLKDTKIGSATNYIESSTQYQTYNDYVWKVTDAFGKSTTSSYNSRGLLDTVTDPAGNEIQYTYKPQTDLLDGASLTADSHKYKNSYTYTNDRITQVAHNTTGDDCDMVYNILYNSLGWNTGTSVEAGDNDITLATNDLDPYTGRLESTTYGNGDVIYYGYDDNYDRVTLISLETTSKAKTPIYEYAYDNGGRVGYMKDDVNNAEYRYEYDILNRVVKVTKTDSTGTSTESYTFNTANEMSAFIENIYGTTYTTSYAYDDDKRPSTSAFGNYSKAITYDSTLGTKTGYSLKNNGSPFYNTSISYVPGTSGYSIASSRIQSITNGSETLSYTYDARGYITQVYKDSSDYSQYRYDALGELTRENYKWGGSSYTEIYAYDVGGNITSKTQYAFVDGDGTVGSQVSQVSYSYNNSNWQDELTSYNGTTLSYDDIGNLTNDGTNDYTWTQGRKLQQISNHNNPSSFTVSYLYNDSGIRIQKTVNGTVTKYNVVGGDVTWQKTGNNNPIYFLYDSGGKLWGLVYNGSTYFYVRDAQNDIIKIVDGSGNVVVQYAYDAWGNLMSLNDYTTAGTLGADNPYRFRGYYYDTETGLYYLNARYYNPQWGRFINADSFGGSTGALLSHNVFAYSLNNPVMYCDPSGNAVSYVDFGQYYSDVTKKYYATYKEAETAEKKYIIQQAYDNAPEGEAKQMLKVALEDIDNVTVMNYKIYYLSSDDAKSSWEAQKESFDWICVGGIIAAGAVFLPAGVALAGTAFGTGSGLTILAKVENDVMKNEADPSGGDYTDFNMIYGGKVEHFELYGTYGPDDNPNNAFNSYECNREIPDNIYWP